MQNTSSQTNDEQQDLTNIRLRIVYRHPEELIPYIHNAKIHEPSQIERIVSSIRTFGFNNPILLDGEKGVIAGHGRLQAALKMGMVEVPTINLEHLSDSRKRAYILADNRLGEVGTHWDFELVESELAVITESLGLDLDIIGFDTLDMGFMDSDTPAAGGSSSSAPTSSDINTMKEPESGLRESNYTRKVESPLYTPKGNKPEVHELYDNEKTMQLLHEIDNAGIENREVMYFLKLAAERHTVFNFAAIAEYYSHAPANIQQLMEKSALVIIDFNQAVEQGFINITHNLGNYYKEDYPDATYPGEANPLDTEAGENEDE